MRHVPHLHLPGGWPDDALHPSAEQIHHLRRVLRLQDGDPVGYTDGSGVIGSGRLVGETVVRGEERTVPDPPIRVTLAVAPPASRDRARFLVEKAGELGVRRLVWIGATHGEGRPPPEVKANAWAVGALEQSRGAHLMQIGGREPLEPPLLVATPGAGPLLDPGASCTVVIGPEGGWADGEWGEATPFGLGPRILRTETAAIVAAGLLLARS